MNRRNFKARVAPLAKAARGTAPTLRSRAGLSEDAADALVSERRLKEPSIEFKEYLKRRRHGVAD